MSENNTADIFSQLLSDPSALSGIASLLGSMTRAQPQNSPSDGVATASDEKRPRPSEDGRVGGAFGIGDVLGAISADPQLLSALPSVVTALSGAVGGARGQSEPAPERPRPPLPSAPTPSPPRVTDRRSALLLALKPYMPKEKAEVIDTVVRVIEIMSMIK